MSGRDGTDDREWDDPPGVDLDDGDDGTDEPAERPKGALNVATEGESFLGDGQEREPLTPGDVSPEHALFVALGVGVTLLVLAQLVI
jgi:hypothetical protein